MHGDVLRDVARGQAAHLGERGVFGGGADGEVGYVVLETDATDADAEALLAEIRAIPGTIRARLLYERR